MCTRPCLHRPHHKDGFETLLALLRQIFMRLLRRFSPRSLKVFRRHTGQLRSRDKAAIVGELLLRLVLVLLSSLVLWADAVPVQHARVELIAQKMAATPGAQLLLGVHFNLENDWHIYWINPGDSGQPPSFHWQLPAGFSAGDVEWPHPDRLSSSELVDYGYKDDVLFIVPIQ